MASPLTDALLGSRSPLTDSLLRSPLTDSLLEDEGEEKKLPWWQEMVRGGGAAGLNLAHSMARGGRALQRATLPGFVEDLPFVQGHFEREDRSIEDLGLVAESLAPPDQRPFLERLQDRPITTLARTGAEAVPSLIPVIAGGLVGGPPGAAAAGAATGFTTSGFDAYDEARKLGNDEGTSLAIGGTVGMLSALLEGIGARGLAKPLKSAFGKELTEKVIRGETDSLIRQALKGGGGEALTEGYQELVAAAGELAAGKPLAEIIETLDDRVAQAGTGGLLLGGVTGGAAVRRNRERASKASRNAQRDLLEQARAMDPEALAQFIEPRAPGEWAMQALPTGEWTVEALTEAREHLDELVVPDVLEPVRKGQRQLRRGVRRSAAWLGAERPVVELVRKGFGDKVGDELQNTLSYLRKATTIGRTIQEAEVRNHANERVAPAYKDIMALASPIQEHNVEDPSKGDWLTQYTGTRDQDGNVKRTRAGARILPGHLKKSPGLRYLEETRWTLRMVDLRDQKAVLADRLAELDTAAQALPPASPELQVVLDERAEVAKEHDAIAFSKKVMKDNEDRLAWLEQHPQWELLKKSAEAASQWDQHMVTMMADAEIISKDQEQKILARGKHYAGFFVATPEAMPPVVRERLTRGAEEPGRVKVGLRRDVPLMLPSEASLFRAATVQTEAYRQVAKNDLLKLVEAAPEFWRQAGVSLEPIEGIHRSDLRVRAMREGEEVPVYMPKELLQAFEQLTPVEGDLVTEGVKTYFKAIANQRRTTALLTPTFAVGQVFRDQPEAALFAAEVGYRPYVEMARGMLHMLTGSPEAKSFRQFGGGMGSIASLDIETSQDMLSDVALRAEESDIRSTAQLAMMKLNRFMHTWKKESVGADIEHKYSGVFYPMARLLETLDSSTRLGAYLRALDKGYSEAEALAVSRRSAIDFALQGTTTAKGSQYLPFMGARAQAFALNREAVKRAGRKSKEAGAEAKDRGWTISQAVALKAGGAALMPVFTMMLVPELVHWLSHADDEEYHSTREDWEKQKYYFWHQLDNGEWIKTPRPMGFLSRVFGYAVGQALDEAYRDEPKTLENVLAVLQDDVPGAAEFPLGFGAKQPLVIDKDMAGFGARTEGVPPGLEPAQLLVTGRTTWQHRLVVPRWQEERVPPRQHGFRTTPPVYIDIAKAIPGNAEEKLWAATHPGEQLSRMANVVTGGRVGSEERFSPTAETSTKVTSPLWLEQYGRFLTGSVGSEIRRTGEIKGMVEAGKEVPLSHLPVVRNFVARAKDAPQMWPVRRVLELAQEGKAYRNPKGQPDLDESTIATKRTYDALAVRAQEIREMLTDWHELRRAGDVEGLQRLDEQIIQTAIDALKDHGDVHYDRSGNRLGSGRPEIGRGRGWTKKFFERLGGGG